MRKFILAVILFSVFLIPCAFASDKVAVIDDSALSKGIIKASYTSSENTAIKIMIVKDQDKYFYNLKSDGTEESFPLQMGNGSYKVSILENVGNNEYAFITTKIVSLSLEDPNIVYLNSIQNINWNNSSKAIKKDAELLAKDQNKDEMAKLIKVHSYVVKNYMYDYDKIPLLTPSYVPEIDPIYDAKKGICYDYSALLASMKRYEGVPVKLIKGYSKNVDGYHAWNEVYVNGKWEIIDSTVDAGLYHSKYDYEMFKPADEYQKVNEY